MLRAVESRFGTLSTYVYPGGYDSAKLGLGPLMCQKNGATSEDKWAGPLPIAVARPFEQSTAIPSIYPWAMQWSSNIDWIFLADNASAATTRRINCYTYNRTTGELSWHGFINEAAIVATNRTIRGFRMRYDKYTTGTAAVSGTAVTGTDTLWSTSGICVGSRIGFGSTDPAQISTWYQISAVGSNTSITLTTSAGTIGNGPYVIEELWAITAETNATATNGGLFVAKGLRFEDFSSAGTNIPAATTVDNIKAVYWLADAATVTNTVSFGLGDHGSDSWTQHYFWVADTLTTAKLYKYNIKAALASLSAGKSTSAWVLTSGVSAAVTGTTSQANNGRICQLSHGPGNGIKCFYFTTTTRVYRSKDITTITQGDTTWLSGGDVMNEVPPGGIATFLATSLQNSVEYASAIDKLIILNTCAAGQRSYVTNYQTGGSQYERLFLCDTKQINQAGADASITPHPALIVTAFSGWSESGLLYLAGIGTTAATNLFYAIPLSVDWEYSYLTNCRLVTPSMSTPNCNRFIRAYQSEIEILGGNSGHNLGQTPEGYRVYYRTTGISDNSGSWTLLEDYGDLSGVTGASAIQFMFEFRTIGITCIPARIMSCCVVYEDDSTDSHYEASVAKSVIADRRFAYRQKTDWGGNIPALRIRLWNAGTGTLILDDNTTDHAYGTFEYSSNGTDWYAWSASQQGIGYYIRYTATSLPDGIKVRALLTQV